MDDVRGIMRPKRHLVSTGNHLSQRNSNVTINFDDNVLVDRQDAKEYSSNYGSNERDFIRNS